MYLSAWAGQVGVSRYAACRWYHAGLPVPVRGAGRLALVEPAGAPAGSGRTVMYAWVSSAGQRPGLGRRVAGLGAWVTASGVAVGEVVTGIGPAVNGRLRKLDRLLADPPAARIAVGHRGRQARLGAGRFQVALAARGRRIMILDPGGIGDGLVRVMTVVIIWFCARLCGRRGAGDRVLRALGWARAGTPGG